MKCGLEAWNVLELHVSAHEILPVFCLCDCRVSEDPRETTVCQVCPDRADGLVNPGPQGSEADPAFREVQAPGVSRVLRPSLSQDEQTQA